MGKEWEVSEPQVAQHYEIKQADSEWLKQCKGPSDYQHVKPNKVNTRPCGWSPLTHKDTTGQEAPDNDER